MERIRSQPVLQLRSLLVHGIFDERWCQGVDSVEKCKSTCALARRQRDQVLKDEQHAARDRALRDEQHAALSKAMEARYDELEAKLREEAVSREVKRAEEAQRLAEDALRATRVREAAVEESRQAAERENFAFEAAAARKRAEKADAYARNLSASLDEGRFRGRARVSRRSSGMLSGLFKGGLAVSTAFAILYGLSNLGLSGFTQENEYKIVSYLDDWATFLGMRTEALMKGLKDFLQRTELEGTDFGSGGVSPGAS